MIPVAVIAVIPVVVIRIDIIPIAVVRIAIIRICVVITASVISAIVAVAVGDHAAEQRSGDKGTTGDPVVVPVMAVAAITPVPAIPNLDDIGLRALCPGHEGRGGLNGNSARKRKSCDQGSRYA